MMNIKNARADGKATPLLEVPDRTEVPTAQSWMAHWTRLRDQAKTVLTKPLTKGPVRPKLRGRLEVALAVVVSGASVVALSTVLQPDPSKLARYAPGRPAVVDEQPVALIDRPEAAPPLKVNAEFVSAIARGDLATMEALYTKDTPPDEMLSAAAESGNTNIVRWVLAHGADIHEAETTSNAPILLADETPDVVALLLERGARDGTLSTAASAGAVNSIERLLKRHEDPNPPQSSAIANAILSVRATERVKTRIVDMLIRSHADPNRDGVGEDGVPLRALVAAVRACEAESKPSVDDGMASPSTGVGDTCLSFIKWLVSRGARADGDALIAAFSLEDSVLDALLASRLEPGATARALTQLAPGWVQSESTTTIKKVAAKGVDWGWREGEEDAALPLVAAVRQHERGKVRALLEAGAPANRRYKDGECALSAAVESPSGDDSTDEARIVELLVERGADVNRRLADGRTPLFAAAEAGQVRVIHVLIDHGARVNELVLDDTALNVAEERGNTASARVIHSRGGRRGSELNPPRPSMRLMRGNAQ